jgi:dolichol-phosphate mannosyltransferase
MQRPTVALVVPTRNEAAHVESFVQRVDAALAPFPVDWHAEVIDDSDDDTPAILRELAGQGAPVEVNHRDPAHRPGVLGGAIRSGLSGARGEVVCVIDADLQHPPEILPDLLAPIVLGRADISVGSRYRRGGSAAGLGSRWRRLAARGAGAAARWLLPATRLTSDPGSGLFALRREVIDSVALRAQGSRVLAEILVRGRWRTVCDVPYRFAVTDDRSPRLGTRDAVAVARELASLWRGRARPPAAGVWGRLRRADRLPGRRRVAPVHVELLRDVPSRLESSPHASTEP